MTALDQGKDALAAAINKAEVYGEYLQSICDAYEAWKKAVDHPPGPSAAEEGMRDEEIGALFYALTDSIEEVVSARCEP